MICLVKRALGKYLETDRHLLHAQRAAGGGRAAEAHPQRREDLPALVSLTRSWATGSCLHLSHTL